MDNKINYDYYFSLGYETVEQIDLFLKHNPDKAQENPSALQTSAGALNSHTDAIHSSGTISIASEPHATGGSTAGPVAPGLYIQDVETHFPISYVLHKFQIDFNAVYIPIDRSIPLDPYNPDDIDIYVKFVTYDAGSGTWLTFKVNAYYGIEYHRHLNAFPDPTRVTTMKPIGADDFNSGTFNPAKSWEGGIIYDTPDGDPAYLTEIPGAQTWHARFAPPSAGIWGYSFNAIVGGATYTFAGGEFEVWDCIPTDPRYNPGYINATNRNFKLTRSQDIFLPLGCVGIGPGSVYTFNRSMYVVCTHAIDQLAANGGNHLRIWCTYEALGIERGETYVFSPNLGVGNYDYGQDRAFDLDGIIEHAEIKGVYVQLVLDERLHYRMDIDEFDYGNNPYSSLIYNKYISTFGLSHSIDFFINNAPGLFFTDPECRKFYKRKLRYFMARWGYSTNVFAFEFFNEVEIAFWIDTDHDKRSYDMMSWQGG